MGNTDKTTGLKDAANGCPEVIININSNGGSSSGSSAEDDVARQAAAAAQATADSKLGNVITKDSPSVVFYGDGTAANPLTAVSAGGVGIIGQYPQVVGFSSGNNKVDAVDAVRPEQMGDDFTNFDGQWRLAGDYINNPPNLCILTRNGLGKLCNAKMNISVQAGDPTAIIDAVSGDLNITIPPSGITADNEPADGQALMAKSNGSGGFTYHWTDLPNNA